METLASKVNVRPLGQSDLSVSPLGLGCWQFSRGSGIVGRYWSNLTDTDILEIVKISLEGGMNWVDTAEIYGGQIGRGAGSCAGSAPEGGQSACRTADRYQVVAAAADSRLDYRND